MNKCGISIKESIQPFKGMKRWHMLYEWTLKTKKPDIKDHIKAHLVLLYFTLLSFENTFFLNKMKICGNSVSSKPSSAIFPTAFVHVSVSHFGNSWNVSKFFIIVFVMVACNHWCYCCKKINAYWRFRWWLAFFFLAMKHF